MNAVFYMQLKRKLELEDDKVARSSELTPSSGCVAVSSPLLTPVSSKGDRIYGRAKVAKYNNSEPQTPMSDVGESRFSFCVNFYLFFYNCLLSQLKFQLAHFGDAYLCCNAFASCHCDLSGFMLFQFFLGSKDCI